MSDKSKAMPKPDSFRLQTPSASDFTSRIDSIFGSLNQLEANHQAWENSSHSDNEKLIKSDPEVSDHHERKRGDFKIPSTQWLPPNRRNYSSSPRSLARGSRTPDYQIHPEKWTKYSLESVSDADMSEASNTAAALDFLRERKQLSQQEKTHSEDVPLDLPVIFQRRRLTAADDYEAEAREPEESNASTVSSTGKLIMPECVVGAKVTAKKARKSVPSLPKADVVKLDYLQDEDDDGEDSDGESDAAAETQQGVTKPSACDVPKKRARYENVEDGDALGADERPPVSVAPLSKKGRIRSLRVANEDDD